MLCTHKTTSLPVWIISSQLHHRISTNSQPFLVGIVSTTDRNTNTPVDLCLSYHLRGGCYSNCQWSSTHRPLTAPERRLMTTFVAQYLPPASNTSTTSSISTTNASPPGAAPMPASAPASAPAAGTSNWV